VTQSIGLELFMHHAGAIPDQHVGAGDALDVVAEMAVRREQDFPALGVQVGHHVLGDTGSDHPVGARFHGGRGIGVDHDLAVRVLVAELGKFVHRAADIQ